MTSSKFGLFWIPTPLISYHFLVYCRYKILNPSPLRHLWTIPKLILNSKSKLWSFKQIYLRKNKWFCNFHFNTWLCTFTLFYVCLCIYFVWVNSFHCHFYSSFSSIFSTNYFNGKCFKCCNNSHKLSYN